MIANHNGWNQSNVPIAANAMAITDVRKGLELMNPELVVDPPSPDFVSTVPSPLTSTPPEDELRKGKVSFLLVSK